MRIIRPYAKILGAIPIDYDEQMCFAMRRIEWVARISHRSEEAQDVNSWKRFIENVVLKHGDWSVTEHVSVSVDSVTDRGITHEWVRHRIASYTQESTRFVNYEKKMPPSFIYPQTTTECPYCLQGHEVSNYGHKTWWHELNDPNLSGVTCKYDPFWLRGIDECERAYKALLADKWRPQEARSVLPNALASRLITTMNLRAWRHFFIMRTTAEAHPQMRQVTIPLLAQFQLAFPLLFDDLNPGCTQADNLKKPQ